MNTTTNVQKSTNTIDVLCVGMATYDLIMTVDHHPGPDEKCFASGLLSCGGGPASNAAVTVSRLGGESSFVGYLGQDLYGKQHVEELSREGVETQWIVRSKQPTPVSVILVKPNGDRTVVSYKSATPSLKTSDIDLAHCNPLCMLFDGHQHLISMGFAEFARHRKIPTILDAGSVHRGTVELLPLMDYLVASARFAREFTGEGNESAALKILSRHAPFVVITLGEKGLLWRSGREEGEMPAFRVESIDTTGAGDTFHGAFSLAIAQGREFLTALGFASAAAALCCTKLGARPGIPTKRELDDFLESKPKVIEV